MRVAFIGLGVMGYPMAGHLRRAGHDVVVFNRTRQKAERWVKEHDGRSLSFAVSGAIRILEPSRLENPGRLAR